MEEDRPQSVFNSTVAKQQLHDNLLKFPPFYTIQEHGDTRKRQLQYWSEITHKFFKDNKIQNSSVSELNSDSFTLFQENSTGIVKRLSKEEIRLILEELAQKGSVKWQNLDNKENFTISWFSSFELADCIHNWAKENALNGGSIETIKFIQSGPQTGKNEKFYNLPEEQIEQALYVLEDNQKGQVLEYNNTLAFKFA